MDILIVDDEKAIADLVGLILKNEDYNIHKFYSSKEAFDFINKGNIIPDLAIIDIMMPEIDGYELLCRIREDYTYPIIMLTAKVEDVDKITGLSMGADDYVTKPFNPLELVARVKAHLRRYKRYNQDTGNIYDRQGLMLNPETHKCTLYDEEIFLTPTEFKILWLLCEKRGKVVSSEEIFENVWGEKYLDSNNTVMVHIRRIREKLNEPQGKPKYIKTVWGVGYKVE